MKNQVQKGLPILLANFPAMNGGSMKMPMAIRIKRTSGMAYMHLK